MSAASDKEMMERLAEALEMSNPEVAELAQAAADHMITLHGDSKLGKTALAGTEEAVEILERIQRQRQYRLAVIKNAREAWERAQDRANQLWHIYRDLCVREQAR